MEQNNASSVAPDATIPSPQPSAFTPPNNSFENMGDTDSDIFELDRLPERKKEVNAMLSCKEHNLVKFIAAYRRQSLTNYAATAIIESAKRDFQEITGKRVALVDKDN